MLWNCIKRLRICGSVPSKNLKQSMYLQLKKCYMFCNYNDCCIYTQFINHYYFSPEHHKKKDDNHRICARHNCIYF